SKSPLWREFAQIGDLNQPELRIYAPFYYCYLCVKIVSASGLIGADDSGETLAQIKAHTAAQGFLLDAYEKGVPGGTGKTFDWSKIPTGIDKPLILAGGLDPDNVAQAMAEVAPYAVDVSSGVEVSPGIKDIEKIQQFMQAVNQSGN
ncbi:MAG: hypothetical protein QMB64_01220, partial [Pseudomonadales bacterium]